MEAQASPAGDRASASSRRPIGEFLVERGLVSPEELAAALQQQRASGKRLGEILVERGAITRMALASVLGEQWEEAGRHLRAVVPVRLADGKEAESGFAGGEELTESLASLQAAVARLEDLAGDVIDSPRPVADPALRDVVERLQAIESSLQDGAAGTLGEQLTAAVESLGRELSEVKLALEQPIAADDALAERLSRIEAALSAPAVPADDGVAERLASLDEWLRARDERGLGKGMRAALEELQGELRTLAEREPTPDPVLAERLERIERALAQGASRSAGDDAAIDTRFDRLESLLREPAGLDALREELTALRASISAAPQTDPQLDERLERIERALADRPADLAARLDELARVVAAPDETVLDRLARIDGALSERPQPTDDGLADRVAELGGRIDALANRPAVPAELVDGIAEVRDAVRATARDEELHERLHRLEDAVRDRPAADVPAELVDAIAELRQAAVTPPRDEELHDRLERLESSVRERPAVSVPTELLEGIAEVREALREPARDAELHDRLQRLEAAVAESRSFSLPDDLVASLRPVRDEELHERLHRLEDAVRERPAISLPAELIEGIAELREALRTPVRDTALEARLDELTRLVAEQASRPEVPEQLAARLDRIAAEHGGAPDPELLSRLERIEFALSGLSPSAPQTDVAGGFVELRDAIAAIPRHDPSADLHDALQRVESKLDRPPAKDEVLHERLGALESRLNGELAARLDGLRDALDRAPEPDALVHERLARIDGLLASLAGREGIDDDDVRGRLERIEDGLRRLPTVDPSARLDELGATVSELHELAARLTEPDHELRARIDRLAADLHEHRPEERILEALDALASSLPQSPDPGELAHRVGEALSSRLDRVEERAGELQGALGAELEGRLGGLGDRIDEGIARVAEELASRPAAPSAGKIADRVAGALGERLDRIEGALAEGSGHEEQLAARLDGLPGEVAGAVREAVPQPAGAGEIARRVSDRLAERFDGLEQAMRERPELELIGGLQARLDEVSGRLSESRDAELLAQLGRIEHELGAAGAALREDLAGPREQLDGLAHVVGRVDAGLAARLDELIGRLGGVEAAVHEAVPHDRLTELADRIDGVRAAVDEPRDAAVRERLDEHAARMNELREALARLEGAVADDARNERVERLDDLVAQLRDAIADPPGTEALTRLVAQSHNALAERLESIEVTVAGMPALPAAPPPLPEPEPVRAPAPAPPAAPPEPAGPTSYLALMPSAEGYSLVDLEGFVPEAGATVDLADAERPFVVARVGRSPLPGDRRRCAFLEA